MKNATPIATSTACLLMASTAWAAPAPLLDYTASLDVSTGNSVWEDVNASGKNFTLGSGVSYNASPTDAPANITAVYTYGTSGNTGSGYNIESGTNPTGGSASFEMLLRPNSNFLNAWLWEFGDSTGAHMSMSGNVLSFGVTGGGSFLTSATNPGGHTTYRGNQFIHVVGVLDRTSDDMQLYINGVLEDELDGTYTSGDWSGGNTGALGSANSAGGRNALGTVDNIGNFTGDIALFRVYNSALSSTDVTDLHTAVGAFAAPPAGPINLLSTTFNDRTLNGNTMENVLWVTNGVADPGNLTVVEGTSNPAVDLAGFFNEGNYFAPNLNLGNEDDWSVDIALNPTGDDIEVIELELSWGVFGNTGGGPSSDSPNLDWVATITGDVSGVVATKTIDAGNSANIATITFDSPVTLDSSENWTLTLLADGSGGGFNAGLDGINVVGNILAPIPEPSSLALLGLGGLLVARRRR